MTRHQRNELTASVELTGPVTLRYPAEATDVYRSQLVHDIVPYTATTTAVACGHVLSLLHAETIGAVSRRHNGTIRGRNMYTDCGHVFDLVIL